MTNNKSNASDFRFHSPLTILEDGQIGSSGYHWSETDNEQNKTTGRCNVFVILFCVQQNEIEEVVDLFLKSLFDILFFLSSNSPLVIVVVVVVVVGVGTNLNWSNGHVLRSESESGR